MLGCIRELTKGVVTGQVDPLPYVFYKEAEYLVNDVDDTYTGYMPQYSALIPRFHVIVNTSCNEMHLLPLFYREDSTEYYDCPADLTTSYLSGSYNPKQDKLELIADALDVNIDWLLGKNVPMQTH